MRHPIKAMTALTAAMVITLTACSSTNEDVAPDAGDEDGIVIAWISPDATFSARWEEQDFPAFEEAVLELAPDATILASTAENEQMMLQQAESAATQGADVIVINPITSDGALPVADLAQREGIAVLSYEGLIAGADIDGYITFDNREVGKLQAQYLADNVADGATVAIMNGAQVCAACIDFKLGAHEVLDPLFDAGSLVLAYEADTPEWSTAEAQTQTDQALTDSDDQLAGILAANDGLAQGVIAALKGRQLEGKVVVTGQDATVAGLQEILMGNLSMTVYKDFQVQALAGAQAAVALARGETPAELTDVFAEGGFEIPALFLAPQIVEKQDIVKLVESGFVSRDELCTGEAAEHCDF